MKYIQEWKLKSVPKKPQLFKTEKSDAYINISNKHPLSVSSL